MVLIRQICEQFWCSNLVINKPFFTFLTHGSNPPPTQIPFSPGRVLRKQHRGLNTYFISGLFTVSCYGSGFQKHFIRPLRVRPSKNIIITVWCVNMLKYFITRKWGSLTVHVIWMVTDIYYNTWFKRSCIHLVKNPQKPEETGGLFNVWKAVYHISSTANEIVASCIRFLFSF